MIELAQGLGEGQSDVLALECDFPAPLETMAPPTPILDLLRKERAAPFSCDENIRLAFRSLLKLEGFKPTGRSKPASEYLEKAYEQGNLRSINAAVDAGNACSLHSGLPISVIDRELARPPYRLAVVREKLSYVFNPSGQSLELQGLLCLWDSQGPCASPVKDSQRSKTGDRTQQTLVLIWGLRLLPGYSQRVLEFYQELLEPLGVRWQACPIL